MSQLRTYALPIAVIATGLLIILIQPWFDLGDPLRGIVTLAFWIVAIVLVIALLEDRRSTEDEVEIDDPALVRFFFRSRRAGLFWLPIRIFVGVSWLDAGLHKLTDPAWTQGGSALRAYWERAVAIPETGRPAITYEWYRGFLQALVDGGHEGWFAWLVTLGELAVGIGLIVGLLTGIAAFFGALLNMSFLLAGSASTNPVMFTLAIGLILAWRVAGYYGLDRYALPALGTPWQRPAAPPPADVAPAPPSSGVS